MILIDTNIIIDFWKSGDEDIKSVILNFPVYICGVVKAELCHGARNEKDLTRILRSLSSFPEVDIKDRLWETVGKNLYKLRIKGVTVPFQDVIIATIAMENSLMVWTNDKHINQIQSVLKDLQVFNYKNYIAVKK
jgi:predicted nucleic acid-binding protein